MSITLELTELSGAEVLVGTGSVLQLAVQESIGGVVQPVAGAEVTVLEQYAPAQFVVVETGVGTASLSDLLLIRADTEAARADAEASEATALAHKNAAAVSEANAAASEAAALAHKNAAAISEVNADASEAAAIASKNAAALSESNADASEAAALASKNAAAASEAAALASKNAAAVSESNALAHKNAAALSETNADASEAAALASKNAAAASEAAALASKNAAAVSEAAALASKNAAGVSATAAGNSAAAALASKNAAAISEANADASAAQAQRYATIVASALIFRGGWIAAGGVFPTPNLDPETSDYYRITVGGTMTGGQGTITVTAGDFLHWDMNLDQWFKVDAVDAVTSVSGRTGDVTLSKSDVGLANVQNVDPTNASNITSGTLAVSRLAASVWHAANLPVQTDGVNVTVNNNLYLGGGSLYGQGKAVLTTVDGWLRLDPTRAFTNGIYLNTGVVRTDGVLQVGADGYTLKVTNGGNAVFGSPRVTVGDGNDATTPNDAVTNGMEHYLEIRGTQATYPSKNGLVFHQERISTSALVHGNSDSSNGYFDLVSDDPNLSVRFGGEEVWNSTTGARGSKSAAGTLYDTADWNSFDRHGVYLVQMSTFASSNGAPPAVYPFGVLTCDVASLGGEQRRVQVYYPHNQDTDKYIYQRTRNAGVWTAWCQIWRGGTGPGSGLVAAKVSDIAPTGDGRNLVEGQMAGDDFFRIRVYGSSYDSGEVEIATADGSNEPIHVRQYSGLFANVVRTLTLLDGSGNTVLPGRLYAHSGVEVAGLGTGLFQGNGDGSDSITANLALYSWFGIGFKPSISGQPVPVGQNSHWFNTRDGSAGMRGALSQNSDIRLKENVEVITDALAKTCSLRGIVYDRKDGGGRLTGVVAQEVQAVLPEAVAVAEDELQTLSVAYGNMVGLLIEAIKELKAEVDSLKTEVAALKAG